MPRLTRAFFQRDTVTVARDLLGRVLVHEIEDQRLAGIVVETEAYTGFDDAASHAHRGRTSRNTAMFGPAGVSYIYLIYGMYWLFNVVAKPSDAPYPAAVLLRALQPVEGIKKMALNREGRPTREWASGPGKLTLALGIDQALDGLDMMMTDSPIYFEAGSPSKNAKIVETGPRIGLGKSVSEPWKSKAWRFWIRDNPHVSRPKYYQKQEKR